MIARKTYISFFGLGSATAAPLLYSYLREHPDLSVPETETEFFSSAKKFAQGTNWYESQIKPSKTAKVFGEFSTAYLASSQAAGLIARTYPNARLLAVIENPLVSVRVAYVMAVKSGQIARQVSLAEFLHRSPEVLLQAKYGRQLRHYFSYYSPNDLLVILAADIRKEPLLLISKVFSHIGVDSSFVPPALRHLVPVEIDETKKPGLLKRGVMLLKKSVVYLYKYLSRLRRKPVTKEETIAEIARRITLSPELEIKLKDYFRSDVIELSSLLHQDLAVLWDFGGTDTK